MNVLRWILVLPSFIVSYGLVRFIALALILIFAGTTGFLYAFCSIVVEGILATMFALATSVWVAPSHRDKVVYALSAFVVIVSAISLFLGVGKYGFGNMPDWQGAITVAAMAVTCLYVSYLTHKEGTVKVFGR
ncbi:MAG: hypothetical protein UCI88_07215 [Megasphaera massiliensis]|uniref:hypothetical protein n=1 Tax=Megasphaera massiliensis TaxID=1232428 RepID=UPI00210DC878|nr:hypothetical protein [Megasphaera massiliensis]MCQ5209384.1 hypothetical protein [Megasphaera massiliensis]MEE0658871.1 hypothetical protein [Megasphaera massiliensis]